MSDEEKNRALPPYHSLVQMVEELYAEHGDNHRGLGYPKVEGFDLRYQVYLDVIRNAAARE